MQYSGPVGICYHKPHDTKIQLNMNLRRIVIHLIYVEYVKNQILKIGLLAVWDLKK